MRPRIFVLVLAVLSACTAGGSPRASGSGNSAPVPTVSPDDELRNAVEEYAACLRSEGIEVSGPAFDDAGRVTAWPAYTLDGTTRAAERACNGDIAEIAFRPRGEAAIFLERAQQFADCMAEHGVTDVEIGLDGIRIGPSRSNRVVMRAERDCRSVMQPP